MDSERVVDNQMPKLSGVKLVERLRELRGRKDFVVGVTGNALLTDQKVASIFLTEPSFSDVAS
jgi:CheY-like chemotaxis protein